MKIRHQKINQLLENFASKKPAPGGGSAAALAGAMAASLVAKVINLTLGKKKFKEKEKDFNQLKREIETLQKELLSLVDQDAQAYQGVIETKGSQEAILKAAEVPLETARKSLAVLKTAAHVSERGNQNLRSDAFCALELAQAGIYGALENVRANLPYLKNEKVVEDLKNQVDSLLEQANGLVKP